MDQQTRRSHRRSSVRITKPQVEALGRLLDTVGKRMPEFTWLYDEGHNDETVATTLGLGINVVANTRRELRGNIWKPPVVEPQPELPLVPAPVAEELPVTRAEFDDLRWRVSHLYEQLGLQNPPPEAVVKMLQTWEEE